MPINACIVVIYSVNCTPIINKFNSKNSIQQSLKPSPIATLDKFSKRMQRRDVEMSSLRIYEYTIHITPYVLYCYMYCVLTGSVLYLQALLPESKFSDNLF